MTPLELKEKFDKESDPIYIEFTKKCQDHHITDQDIEFGWIVRLTWIESKNIGDEVQYKLVFSHDPVFFNYNFKRALNVYPDDKNVYQTIYSEYDFTKENVTQHIYLMSTNEHYINVLSQEEMLDKIGKSDDKFIKFMKKKYPMFMGIFLKEFEDSLEV